MMFSKTLANEVVKDNIRVNTVNAGLILTPADPEGMLQGRTNHGVVGYFGPRRPVGDKQHHYHFQILALDKMLDIPPGAARDQVLAAAEGHVIAKGELIGTYAQTVAPPK